MLRADQTVLVVAGGGRSGHILDWSRSMVRAAVNRGVKLVVADLPQNLEMLAAETGVETMAVDWTDESVVVEATQDLARRADLGAVVGFREFCLRSTAVAAESRGLPWNPVSAVDVSRDKWRCRQVVSELGLTQPLSIQCRTSSEVVAAASRFDGSMVVKPASAYGSQGVELVRVPAEAVAAAEKARGYDLHQTVLVEEAVDGVEYSAEGAMIGGTPVVVAVHLKRRSPGTFFSNGHRTADDLGSLHLVEIDLTVRRVLLALGVRHSIFHVEFWQTADGVVLGEVHTRPGGNWLHLLTRLSSGHDLFDLVLADLMGEAAPSVDLGSPVVGAASAAIPYACGEVTEISGTSAVAAEVGFAGLDLLAVRGDRLDQPRESGDRAGMVFATAAGSLGTRGRSAAEIANRLAGKVVVTTA